MRVSGDIVGAGRVERPGHCSGTAAAASASWSRLRTETISVFGCGPVGTSAAFGSPARGIRLGAFAPKKVELNLSLL
jgi:hypothetical protein